MKWDLLVPKFTLVVFTLSLLSCSQRASIDVCYQGQYVNNICYLNSCQTPCKPDEVCVEDNCVQTACVGVECPSGQVCAQGNCYPKNCQTDCGADEVCVDVVCTHKSCVGVECPTDQVCVDGNCYPKDCSTDCGANEVCVDVICVEKLCVGVDCPSDQVCLKGNCYPKNCDTDCNGSQVCIDLNCVHKLCVDVECSLDQACVQGECLQIICQDSSDCDDNNPCTQDSCDQTVSCQNIPVTDGASCVDVDVCNGAETCQSGGCTPGQPLLCDDGVGCTDDSCDAVFGCQYINNNSNCDDAQPATTDTCDPSSPSADPNGCVFDINTPPVASFYVSPGAALVGETFSLDATSSWDNEDPIGNLTFYWDYEGDNTYVPGTANETTSFATTGLKTIQLRVEDKGMLVHYTKRYVIVSAPAEIIIVDSDLDVVDGGDGVTTLREAIQQANTDPNPNTITFSGPMVIMPESSYPLISDNDTTIIGQAGVIIDGSNSVQPAHDCLMISASSIRIHSLTIRSCVDDGIDQTNGSFNWIANCEFYDNGGGGIDIQAGSATTIGPENIFNNNLVGVETAGSDTRVIDNISVGNTTSGLLIAATSSIPTVRLNTFGANTHGIEIAPSITNIEISHNTISYNTQNGIFWGASAPSNGHSVQNNILSHNGSWGISNNANVTFTTIDYNDYFNNVSGGCTSCPAQPNSISVDPSFIDRLSNDYRLQFDSLCIDQGSNLGIDLNGPAPFNSNGAPDIGAWESP